jgi:DNA-binding NtrC family response regulator
MKAEGPLAISSSARTRPGRNGEQTTTDAGDSTERAAVLIVDDDPFSLSALEALVRAEGLDVETAEDLASARMRLEAHPPAAVLADYGLPDGSGLELAERCAELGVELVVVTGQASLEMAVLALRAGAADFLTKPVDVARLKTMLDALVRAHAYRREIADLRSTLRDLGRFGSMIGSSPPMQAVYDRIGRVAASEATVLVTGESGTGKELVAETVHRLSRRAHRPLVAVNCGAISANLVESELFGHERGSFTGADRQRRGVFERAHQGTLFLDEISEMPLELQVKLLRVLESGSLTRVGGEKAVAVDVRVVAASNRDLDALAAEGKFRSDLLYRLRVVPIELPPLRERGEDIRALATHFLAELCQREGQRRRFAEPALRALDAYSFPGNVRELRNAVQQAFILAEDEIRPEHLPAAMAAAVTARERAGGGERGESDESGETDQVVRLEVPCALADAERQIILASLGRLGGDKTRAAEVLGISLKTLYSRLREYGARERT